MRPFRFLALGALLLGAALPGAQAVDDQAAASQAELLVRQLGDGSFRARERATRQLRDLGLPAKGALMRGLRSDDAEIRERCRRILVDVLEDDYQARVDAFAADRDGKQKHTLPGWERFRDLSGESPQARELFVEMQRHESKLLETAATDVASGALALASRCEELQQSISRGFDGEVQQLSLGNIAAVFFVASDPQLTINDRIATYLHNFSYQPAMQLGLRGGSKSEPLKRILGAWVVRTAGSANAYPGLMLSMQYDLPEGLQPATDLVGQVGSQPQFLQFALLVIGRFGGPEHIRLLEPLLDNSNALFMQNVNGKSMRCDVRDVALAVLVHLSGQELKDYGLARVQRNAQMLFNTSTIGFTDETDRTQAIKKWRTWSASHKGDSKESS